MKWPCAEEHARCHRIFWGRVVSVLASVCNSPAGSPPAPRGVAVSDVTKKEKGEGKKKKKKIPRPLFVLIYWFKLCEVCKSVNMYVCLYVCKHPKGLLE